MNKGMKNDFKDDKLRWDLLPLKEIEDIVKVYTEGAKKYSDNSWQLLDNGYDRYKAALFRHLVLFEKERRQTAKPVVDILHRQLGMQQRCCTTLNIRRQKI